MSREPPPIVRDVMSSEVVTAVPEMTLREAFQTLLDAGVRSAPVLDGSGKTVGIVSQDDLAARALAGPDRELDRTRVGDVMREAVPVVAPGHPLDALLGCFLRENQRRALVMENGILVGIVTPVDALRGLSEP